MLVHIEYMCVHALMLCLPSHSLDTVLCRGGLFINTMACVLLYVNSLINWYEWKYLAKATDLFRIAEGVVGLLLRHLLALKMKLKIYGRII